MCVIDSFNGEFRFLSNFAYSEFTLYGTRYPTVEHAYQALKCVSQRDHDGIATARTPGVAKKLGRVVQLREDWEQSKDAVMIACVYAKFKQNPHLAEQLRNTRGCTLIEGNTWGDHYWGVCKGTGQNMLGQILMRVRDMV